MFKDEPWCQSQWADSQTVLLRACGPDDGVVIKNIVQNKTIAVLQMAGHPPELPAEDGSTYYPINAPQLDNQTKRVTASFVRLKKDCKEANITSENYESCSERRMREFKLP